MAKRRRRRGLFRKKLELGSKKSSVSKAKPITKPVNKQNFPTKPTNKLGLKTITPIRPEKKIISS